jgi:hypothetical protein
MKGFNRKFILKKNEKELRKEKKKPFCRANRATVTTVTDFQ